MAINFEHQDDVAVTATIVGCLRAHARSKPQAPAFSFHTDGRGEPEQLSFGELDVLTERLAQQLRAAGLSGRHALLLFPTGLDFIIAFLGCLKAGVIAIPMPEARKAAHWQRLQVVQRTVEVAAVLLPSLEQAAAIERELAVVPLAVSRALLSAQPDSPAPPLPAPASGAIAFLQFTSGSTGDPKGVRVSHANIMANQRRIAQAFGSDSNSVGVGWLPMFHDMGLIGNLLHPVFVGFPNVLLAPAAILRRPMFWLETIARVGATISGGPSFIYRLCAERAVTEGLDLSQWRVAFCGAERIDAAAVQRFMAWFAPAGFDPNAFLPCYGLAEATLLVAGGPPGRARQFRPLQRDALARGVAVTASGAEPAVTLVGCGRVEGVDRVCIVDPDSGVARASGQVGEIWVAGPSVADGYANHPAATAAQFGRRMADGSGPWMASGDDGFVDADGELFVSGRRKELIIINGRNYFPQDIEQEACAAAPELDAFACAAFSVERDGREQVILVAELRREAARHADLPALQQRVRLAAAEGELALAEVALVRPHSLPRTSSGKLERLKVRRQYRDGQLQLLLEPPSLLLGGGALAELVAEVTGMPVTSVDLALPASALGLNSLQVYQLCFVLEQHLQLLVEPEVLLGAASMGDALAGARPTPPVRAGSTLGPLSPGQLALWLEQQQYPDAALFTLCFPMQLGDRVDPIRLEEALERVIQTHPQLTAQLRMRDGAPEWWQPEERLAVLSVVSAEHWSQATLQEALTTLSLTVLPLERAALLQVHLWHRRDGDVLVLLCHHIIADAWSVQQFAADFTLAWRGQALPAAASYSAFVDWQADWLQGETGTAARAFWSDHMLRPVARLAWPGQQAQAKATLLSVRHQYALDGALCDALAAYAAGAGATLFEVLLSVYALSVSVWSGERHFAIALPMLGRPSALFARTQGYCVQLAVLRFGIQSGAPFSALLADTVANVRASQRHQWLPQLEIASQGRDNHYQTLFTMHDFLHGVDYAPVLGGLAGKSGSVGDWSVRALPLPPMERREDLALSIVRTADGLAVNVDFQPGCIGADMVELLVAHWRDTLSALVRQPHASAAHLAALPTPLHSTQLAAPLVTAEPDWLGAIWARHTSEVPALVCGEHQFDYQQLLAWAARVSEHLRQHGVGPGTRVAVLLPREPALVAALLGVLLVGAAYVPLDPNYPAARTRYILEQAHPTILLTTADMVYALPGHAAPLVLDIALLDSASPAAHAPGPASWPAQQTALVIYTSGSTGRPKGVEITYGAMGALHNWARHAFPESAWQGVAATTSVCFDLSVYELFSTLFAGGTIHLLDNALAVDPTDCRIRLLNTVPSACRELLDTCGLPAALEVLNLAGEALPGALVEAVLQRHPGVQINNLYGPTEDTTYSTHAVMRAAPGDRVTIGHVLPGGEALILNADGDPVPRGTIGELYLGGQGLAQGYFRAPGMTAERFVPHPRPAMSGARLYRTGDLVRLNAEGALELLGRADHQIKLRGYRIETGEVAAALQALPGVTAAAVLHKIPPAVRQAQLEAYVAGAPDLHAPDLHAALSRELPAYMVPAVIHLLVQLPLTPNGKIDRLALAALTAEATYSVAPTTATETSLLALWQRLLERSDLGVADDFFMAGGHSMLVMRMLRELNTEFGLHLDVAAIFQHRTVSTLAAHLDRLRRTLALAEPARVAGQNVPLETFEI